MMEKLRILLSLLRPLLLILLIAVMLVLVVVEVVVSESHFLSNHKDSTQLCQHLATEVGVALPQQATVRKQNNTSGNN